MPTIDTTLLNACKRDRQFQDKKYRELQYVHDILRDDTLDKDEKFVSLVVRGFGRQRARELVNMHNGGMYNDTERVN